MKKDIDIRASVKSIMEIDDSNHSDFEGIASEDVGIPFISILQDLSPQVKKGPGKVDGAESGDIYESVNQHIWKTGLAVVPCAFQKRWIEWIPRDSGGGFVRSHADEAILSQTQADPKGRTFLPNGNEIVPTAIHFILAIPNNGLDSFKAIISMARTQRKKSKNWLGKMMSNKLTGPTGRVYTPRMCRYTYILTSVIETKDNNTYYNWNISKAKLLEDESIYQEALNFANTFTTQRVDFGDSKNIVEDVI